MRRSVTHAEYESWLQTKAGGRSRFIWLNVFRSLVLWAILVPAIEVLGNNSRSISPRSIVLMGIITFPIFLLEGCLVGRWRWKGLEKKYPDNGLPPWE